MQILGNIIAENAVQTDTIVEHTTDAGVTIDGVLIKDGAISKSVVGLGNVDNTSDLNKPISTATQAALDLKSDTTHNHSGVYEPANSIYKRTSTVFQTHIMLQPAKLAL